MFATASYGQVDLAIDRGETWLLGQQSVTGQFGTSTGLVPRDTATSILALISNRGQEIQVRITVPAENVDILRVPLFPNPKTLVAAVTMAKEG